MESTIITTTPEITSSSQSNGEDPPMVGREEWNATEPKRKLKSIEKLPVPYAIIGQTKTTSCKIFVGCCYQAKVYQRACMAQGKADVDFNFLVGGDGYVYECRGWDIVGEHDFDFNDKSIGVGLIGDFWKRDPTKEQLETTLKLLQMGVRKNKLTADYKLLGQDPSINVYIKDWEHWSSKS